MGATTYGLAPHLIAGMNLHRVSTRVNQYEPTRDMCRSSGMIQGYPVNGPCKSILHGFAMQLALRGC